MKNTLAILGEKPMFKQNEIPFMQPTLPRFEDLESSIRSTIQTGILTKGRYVEQYEEALADHLNAPYVVAVSSCTTGLMLTLRELGITGEVLVPSFTFCATVHAIVWAGAKPVFVDCEPGAYTIDMSDAERKVTPRTSAIVPVHIFGVPVDSVRVQEFSDTHGLKVVYDAAHAMGSKSNGVPVGCNGDAEVFSTSPTKLLVTGEGGFVVTRNAELARLLRVAREYGNPGDYNCTSIGINGRLGEYGSILGFHSLKMLNDNVEQRNRLAALYRGKLKEIPGIKVQSVPRGTLSTFKDLSIEIDPSEFGMNRDQLAHALRWENIPTRKYFSPPVHKQMCYDEDIFLPITDLVSSRVLSLPLFAHMPLQFAERVVEALQNIRTHAGAIVQTIKG